MILNEIDKLRDDITATTAALETTYSTYVRHFPLLIQRLGDLRAFADAQELRRESVKHDLNAAANVEGIEFNPTLSDCKALVVIAQPEPEPEPGLEAMEDEELDAAHEAAKLKARKEYKLLVRRCLQLCHPDKLKRFSSAQRIKLHDLFNEVREIQHSLYMNQLITFYVMIRVVRGEAHMLDASMMEPLNRELRDLKSDYNDLLHHPLCEVIVAHRNNQLHTAKQIFRAFMEKQIQDMEDKLKEA